MKTLEELLKETEQLQTLANLVAKLHGEISEMIHAEEEKGKGVDFTSVLRTAERHPITPHPLDGKDAHVIESYLTLLLSVAVHDTSSAVEDNPFVYPCRIAADLRPAPDMGMLFKRSLTFDENSVNEAIAAVEREQLVDFFVLDALRLIELYDHGNLQKLEYVSDLAALMNVSRPRMEELLMILKASMEEQTKFKACFRNIEFSTFLPYLPSIKAYAIETPSELLVNGVQEEDVLPFFPVSSKKRVYLRNVHFDGKMTPMTFSDVATIEIIGCRFEHFFKGVFDVKKCRLLNIQTSEFINCNRQGKAWMGVLPPAMPGIIGELQETEALRLKSCDFQKCVVYYESAVGLGGIEEDKEGNCLFKGINEREIINCHNSDSCPIYK